MSTVRVVRPRPLALTDRIPVFWPGTEPSQELKQIDGGALLRHLVAATTPIASRKRKRTEQYHAPREGEAHEHWSPARRAAEQAAAAGPIAIPKVRVIEDYHLNQQAAAHHGPMIRGNIAAAPYLRHQQPGGYDEHQQGEYNVDDEDVAWLNNTNSKNGQGLFAAAVGLYRQMSQRISGSSEASTPRAQDTRLSVDEFERVIDTLELAHFAAVKAWWEEQQDGPSTSTPQVPKIPPMKSLLPRGTALDLVAAVVPDRKLAAQLLDYWLRKRQAEGGPLLARLWFEQPWKFVAFARFIHSDDDDIDEHMPFMAVEPRSAMEQRRTAVNRRRISEEDAVEALFNMRSELEMLRTLADQVRKREKLKRQLLVTSQQEMQMRQELGLPPRAPVPKTARLHQLARINSVAAGATGAGVAAATAEAAGLTRAESSAAAAARGASSPAAAPKAVAAGRAVAATPAAGAGRSIGPQRAADINRIVAKAADAAAAAASPHEGERPRQTRTAAAAAAAAFEIAFAAKHAKVAAEMGLPAAAGGLAQLLLDSVMPPVDGAQQQQQRDAPVAQPSTRAGAAKAGRGRAGRRQGRVCAQPVQGSKQVKTKASRLSQRKQRVTSATAAAADGDADDEREDSAGQPDNRPPSVRIASETLEPPRRRRRLQSEPAVQPSMPERDQQQPMQVEQATHLQGRQRRAPRQQSAAGTLAGVPGTTAAVEAVSLSSSTSVTSDDSGDADYSVSSDEAEGVKPGKPPLQRYKSRQQQTTHQLRGRGRQVAAAASSSDDSSHEQEEFEEDSDDHFQAPSRRAVALRRPRQAAQQSQQQCQLRGAPSAGAEAQVAAVAVRYMPRRKGSRVGQQHLTVQQQQQPVSQPTQKQTVLQRGRRSGLTSLAAELTSAAESDSEASSSGKESDLAVSKPPGKQQRLLRARRPGLLPPAGHSGAAVLQSKPAGVGAGPRRTTGPLDASTEAAERRVLRPHNHQPREVPYASQRSNRQAGQLKAPGAAGTKLPGNVAQLAAGGPVPAKHTSSQQPRPASGVTRSASARKPAAAAAAVRRSLGHRQHITRAAIGAAELRSLGLQAPGAASGRR